VSRRAAILLLAACAACATGRGAYGAHQIDQPLPAAASLPEGPDRDALQAAQAQEAHGDAAGVAHDTARAEWAGAGTAYAELAGRPGFAEWRVPMRLRASELLLRAQRWDNAATAAGALVSDAQSSDVSRAVGARLVATAWIGAANASAKAGQLEKLDLGPEKKEGPRPPPPAWRRVVESADAYLARAGADLDGRTGPADRPLSGPQIALAAAEVQFAYGELDDVRKRLDAALDRWPSDAKLLDEAVPLYLATYLARGDRDGHLAAIEQLRVRAEAVGAKAPADRKAAFAKVVESLSRARAGGRFALGEELLRQKKPAEAAQAFEAAASDTGALDAANALHNAGVAWDQAGEPGKAAAARERLLRDHPEAGVTAEDALRLATFRSRKGDHAAAARTYEEFLQRWPDSPSRCVALRNVASELDVAGRLAEAAARYLAFGGDEKCAKADPGIAARALVRSGRLFEGQAKAAYGAAVTLDGVTDSEAKAQLSEAKKRLKGL
jgi:tetratricopeptide (TPR) repeat protein